MMHTPEAPQVNPSQEFSVELIGFGCHGHPTGSLENAEYGGCEALGDGGTTNFKTSVARQLRSLELALNAQHEHAVSLLKAEIQTLRGQLLLNSPNQDTKLQTQVPVRTQMSQQAALEPNNVVCTEHLFEPVGDEGKDSMSYSQISLKAIKEELPELKGTFHKSDPKFWTCIQRFVFSWTFEALSSIVIIANCVFMALDLQYEGVDARKTIEVPGFYNTDQHDWLGNETTFVACTTAFTILFCIELILRVWAKGRRSFTSFWICADTVIVALGLLESVGVSELNPGMVRIMRLLRFLRLVKLFEVFTVFDSLILIVKSIEASFFAMLWSFVLLFFINMVVAMFLTQLLQQFIEDKTKDPAKRMEVWQKFGTFARSILTMFEITQANWVPTCRLLFEDVHEMFAVFYILYRCMFWFSVLRVLTAVFITETNRVVAHDGDLTLLKKRRDRHLLAKSLGHLFQTIDMNGDGTFTRQELEQLMHDPKLLAVASAHDFDKWDLMKIFWLLDDGTGQVSIADFCGKTAKMKGQSKAVDVQAILKLTHGIQKLLSK